MSHTTQSQYRRYIFHSAVLIKPLIDIRNAGIGVHVSIYIQAFLILAPRLLKFIEVAAVTERVISAEITPLVNASDNPATSGSEKFTCKSLWAHVVGAIELTDVNQMIYPSLFLGYALIISSV